MWYNVIWGNTNKIQFGRNTGCLLSNTIYIYRVDRERIQLINQKPQICESQFFFESSPKEFITYQVRVLFEKELFYQDELFVIKTIISIRRFFLSISSQSASGILWHVGKSKPQMIFIRIFPKWWFIVFPQIEFLFWGRNRQRAPLIYTLIWGRNRQRAPFIYTLIRGRKRQRAPFINTWIWGRNRQRAPAPLIYTLIWGRNRQRASVIYTLIRGRNRQRAPFIYTLIRGRNRQRAPARATRHFLNFSHFGGRRFSSTFFFPNRENGKCFSYTSLRLRAFVLELFSHIRIGGL